MVKGQIPPGLFAGNIDLLDNWQLDGSSTRTNASAPNVGDGKNVPGNSSLLGAHWIAAIYPREVSFNLAEDFMPALGAPTVAAPCSGTTQSWGGLVPATPRYAWVIGAKVGVGDAPNEMVWWASSRQQAFGGCFGTGFRLPV